MAPSLASRLLFHGKSDPPFLSPHASPELTAEVYDLIALCLRAYVSPWWSKITRYDKDFLPHISTIVTHFLRALDARTPNLDLPGLVFHDFPALLTQHIIDYRNAEAKTHTAYACGGAATLPVLFAGLQPHMAISPAGVLDREYYRQIFDRVLHVCLPPEDYAPEAERIIVREIIVKLLIDDIIPKTAQPWFIQTSILALLGTEEEESSFIPKAPPRTQTSTNTSPFSFHTVVVFTLSALQSFSGMCLALINSYKHAISTIKLVQSTPVPSPRIISGPSPATTFVPRPTPLSKSVSGASAISLSSSKDAPSDIIPATSKIHRTTPSLISTASSVLSPDATPTPTALNTNARPSIYTAPSLQSPSSSYHQPPSTFQHPLASVPSTSSQTTTASKANPLSPQQGNPGTLISHPLSPEPQKDYAMPPLLLLSMLLNAFSTQQPAPPASPTSAPASATPRFTTTLLLTLTSMLCTLAAPFLDKLLPYLLHRFLSPAFILNVVRTSKHTLFPVPGGYPGPPPPPDPTLEEQAAIRAQTINAIRRTLGLPPTTSMPTTTPTSATFNASTLPSGNSAGPRLDIGTSAATPASSSSLSLPTLSPSALMARLLLGPDAAADETIGAALDAFSERECNVRFLVFLLDRVVLGLFPELAGEAI